jgi:hypothetical protein
MVRNSRLLLVENGRSGNKVGALPALREQCNRTARSTLPLVWLYIHLNRVDQPIRKARTTTVKRSNLPTAHCQLSFTPLM